MKVKIAKKATQPADKMVKDLSSKAVSMLPKGVPKSAASMLPKAKIKGLKTK